MKVARVLLIAAAAVLQISLALSVNLGFYTLWGALGVLATTAIVVAECLRRQPVAGTLHPVMANVLLFGPGLFIAAHLVARAAAATNPWETMALSLLGFVAALVILLAWLARRRATDAVTAPLIGLGCLLTGLSIMTPQLRFGDPDRPDAAFMTAIALALTLMAVLLVWLSFLAQPALAGRPGGWLARWGLLLVLGGGLRVLAITGSPEPVIDVHTWLTHAPRFLLQGENPYSASYPSPYGTERALRLGINQAPEAHPASYSPGAVLTGVPAVLLNFDVRYMNVAAELVAALALLLIGRRRGRLDLGVLASGLYLCLPRAPFMIEQAWYEPQLAACVGLLVLWLPRRPWAASVALGGLLSLKQYVVVLAPALAGMCRRRPRVAMGGLIVAAAVSLPLILWDAGAFWQVAVKAQLGRAVVTHALTLPALLHNQWGLDLPRLAVWPVLLALVAWLGWRTPADDQGAGGMNLAAALLVFCVLVQGFPNYYYLAEFLLLLGIVQSTTGAAGEQAPVEEATGETAG